METKRWEHLRSLFEECVELGPGERDEFLERASLQDDPLRRELLDLLEMDARYDGCLEPPEPAAPAENLAAREIGRRIGPWRLEAVLGRGGMSTVYRARRTEEEFEQLAAVKLVRRGMDTEDILRRFRLERQVLADLEHPGIAHLLDGGATEEGLPFLVMEYVQGLPVDRYCAEHSLGVEARLRLFLSIAEAVQHAHEHGVIHRDLKPSNILVTEEGRPKLLDFGIAKVLDTAASSGTVNVTATELRLMTPEYASPEQVRGHAIGPASDVYSLGVVLYELLSGHRPYQLTTRLRHELERAICEFQPPRPSAVVGRAPESRRLRARLAGDLDTIVLMALRKEPERRYATVSELTEDLERWLHGRPVLARPDTWRYRSTKFVRRNKGIVAATLAVVLALAAGLVASLASRAETAEALRQSRARGFASASTEVLQEDTMLALLLARKAVDLVRTPETLSRLHEAVSLVRERSALPSGAAVAEVIFSPSREELLVTAEDAAWLWGLDGKITPIQSDSLWLRSGRFSPSGDHVLTAQSDGAARLFDREGQELACFVHGEGVALWTAEFSSDGWYLLTAAGDGTVKIWRTDDDSRPVAAPSIKHAGAVVAAAFAPDGEHILTASQDMIARVWEFDPELDTLGRSTDLVGHEGSITCASFSSAGDLVVTASGDGKYGPSDFGLPDRTARIWDLTGTEVAILGEDGYEVEWATFSPAGTEVLTSSADQGGRLYGLDEQVLQEYPIPSASSVMMECAFSRDGKVVGFCCEDGSTWLFELSGTPIGSLHGHDEQVTAIDFSPDGRFVATGSMDLTARLWSVRDERLPAYRGHRGTVYRAVHSPDGTKLATCSWDFDARVWDVGGDAFTRLVGHEEAVNAIAFDTEGQRLVTCSLDSTARIWDLDGTERQVLPHGAKVHSVRSVAFSSDGKRVATACHDASVWVWNTDGTVHRHFPPRGPRDSWASHVEFSHDGEELLVVKSWTPVQIVSVDDGSARSLDYLAWHATYTPEGQVLIACRDGRVALVTDRGELVREFSAHESALHWVSLSPRGDQIVTASQDGTARIWSLDGDLHAILRGHDGIVSFAEFSPDGDRVVTAGSDGTTRTWIVDREELLELAAERTTRGFTEAEYIRYQELLDVPAREAKELVDRLFEELTDQERVVEHLWQAGGLDDELRELALRFAEERSDSPFD